MQTSGRRQARPRRWLGPRIHSSHVVSGHLGPSSSHNVLVIIQPSPEKKSDLYTAASFCHELPKYFKITLYEALHIRKCKYAPLHFRRGHGRSMRQRSTGWGPFGGRLLQTPCSTGGQRTTAIMIDTFACGRCWQVCFRPGFGRSHVVEEVDGHLKIIFKYNHILPAARPTPAKAQPLGHISKTRRDLGFNSSRIAEETKSGDPRSREQCEVLCLGVRHLVLLGVIKDGAKCPAIVPSNLVVQLILLGPGSPGSISWGKPTRIELQQPTPKIRGGAVAAGRATREGEGAHNLFAIGVVLTWRKCRRLLNLVAISSCHPISLSHSTRETP